MNIKKYSGVFIKKSRRNTMSNPKYRNPTPDPKEVKTEPDNAENDKPEAIIHQPDAHILSAKVAEENPELVEQFDRLVQDDPQYLSEQITDAMYTADPEARAKRLNAEAYRQRNIFTRAITKF